MLQPWVTSGVKESLSSTECAIQVVCRADQRKVRECLGKVSQCFSVRSCFFSEQPEVIGIGQHFLEDQPRVFEPGPVLSSRSSQGLDEPERAVDCHPTHHFRVEKVLLSTSYLPNSFVFLIPMVADPVHQLSKADPKVVRNRRPVLVVEINRVH